MKRRISRIIGVLVLIAGIGLYLYPQISQHIFDNRVFELASEFEQTDLDSPDLEELYRRLVAENQKLYNEGQKDLVDPFSYELPGIDLTEYGLPDNCIGFMNIPKIDEYLPIYLGASNENMAKGLAHLTQTSYTVGGENTNSVLAGHRGSTKGTMLRHIHELVPGDIVIVQNFRETLRYQVSEIKIIEPTEVDEILIRPGRDMLTLMSCEPFMISTHRYLVYCERIME